MGISGLSRKLLLVCSVAFVVSAWLYCIATIHTSRPDGTVRQTKPSSNLIVFFRDHGDAVLLGELIALGLCAAATVLAERRFGSNRYRSSRRNRDTSLLGADGGNLRNKQDRDSAVVDDDE